MAQLQYDTLIVLLHIFLRLEISSTFFKKMFYQQHEEGRTGLEQGVSKLFLIVGELYKKRII